MPKDGIFEWENIPHFVVRGKILKKHFKSLLVCQTNSNQFKIEIMLENKQVIVGNITSKYYLFIALF